MARIATIKPRDGWERGIPQRGTPRSAALPEDPWLAEWQPRNPGPTRLADIEEWDRGHDVTLAIGATALDVEVDLTELHSPRFAPGTGHRLPTTDESGNRSPVVEKHGRLVEPPSGHHAVEPTPAGNRPAPLHLVGTEHTLDPSGDGTDKQISGRSLRHATVLAVYFLALIVSATLWYFALGTLVVSRGAALVSHWQVTTIATGSMNPALSPGDLVAYAPIDVAELRTGDIIVFDNPASPGSTLVHRLVGFNGDGTFATKGDANPHNDSTPVPAEAVRGIVKMVSPFGGYPTMLLHRGQSAHLAALIGLLLLAVIVVHAPAPGDQASGHRPKRSRTRRVP